MEKKRIANNVENILTYEYLKSVHKVLEVKEIAEATGCGRTTVRKYLHKYGLSIKNSRVGKCAKEKHPLWRGGKYIRSGYVMVRVGKGEYVREHLLVMEEFLGRTLYRDECVHHINGDRADNRIENLLLLDKKMHDRFHLVVRNKNKDYTTLSISEIIELIYPNISEEFKMYAELTRIGIVRDRG